MRSYRGSIASAAGVEASAPASDRANCFESGADTVVVSTMAALEVAVAAAPPGRNILVAPGTYGLATITLKGNGAQGNPIVVRPQNGLGTVTINDPRWTFGANSSWLIVEKFYFTGSRIVLQGDHNRISRCHFTNINVNAAVAHLHGRDCRVDHCDFSDLVRTSGNPTSIGVDPRAFATGAAARLLIDYNYFHDMNPATGQNGMEPVRLFAHVPSLELARGQTITVDHCLFENIDIPNEGEAISVKIGGFILRFCTFDNVGLYYSHRVTRDSEVRSCWFEQMKDPCLNVFGPDHLVIGNRFVGHLSVRIAAGDVAWADMMSGAAPLGGYAPATNCEIIGNRMGSGRLQVGGYWSNKTPNLPATSNLCEANTRDSGGSAEGLTSAWEADTTVHSTTTEPYTPAVKLIASDVGLNASDPSCT